MTAKRYTVRLKTQIEYEYELQVDALDEECAIAEAVFKLQTSNETPIDYSEEKILESWVDKEWGQLK